VRYVPLHDHTTFSYMDGFGTPEDHVNRCADLGISALALTEHGNVSSHVGLEKAANKAGIKPIFGLEAYTHPDPKSQRKFHLTLLAADAEGYRNLMRIVTRSWDEGFYQWPTVSGQMLADHSDGIIALSGCSDSLLSCSLLGGKTIDSADAGPAQAERVASAFKELLGDRYYLECQMFPELERTRTLNPAFERMGKKLGIPIVATADVHYPMPDDNDMQLMLHAAGRGASDVAKQAEGWEYNIRLTYPTSDQMVIDRLRGTNLSARGAVAAARATVEIGDRCNVVLPKADKLRFPLEPGQTTDGLMTQLLRDGWRYRVRQGNKGLTTRPDDYVARIEHERRSITGKDFNDYHLMISDLTRYAKDNGIGVGPARGSAASSLVCYLLRITEIDPMEYPLMNFERYIAPDREDEPDVDLDFDDDRRWEVFAYAARRYGADHVGKIATFTQYKAKNSLDDVARVHRVPKPETEALKDMVIERSGGDSRTNSTLMDSIEMFPAARAITDKWPDLLKATRLEGNYRGMSVHAAGLVIANVPISDICAQYTREVNGVKTVAVSTDKKDTAYLGLMKVDVLGLSTMGMIRLALEEAGLSLEDLYRIPVTDAETLAAFARNDVVGIFQFEGRATRVVNREVRPKNFAELADINGLSRPGPLFSGTTEEYINVGRGKVKPTKYHPIIDALTASTRGQIIYQEQVLAALRDFGGLSVARVHEIRRIISQKLGEAQFNTSSEDFIAEAVRLHGVKREVATAVWGRLVTSASYSFNIAHCVSYAMLAFWCMWLKVHYPAAFYRAQLRKTKEEGWPRLIRDAENHGLQVRGVTLGLSKMEWETYRDPHLKLKKKAQPRTIVAGWTQLKGVGPSVGTAIVEHEEAMRRATGEGYSSVDDLLAVRGIGAATLLKFRGQIEDEDPFGLQKVHNSLERVRASIRSGEIPLRYPTHTSAGMVEEPVGKPIVWLGVVYLKEFKDAVEDERARSGREVEDIRRTMKAPELVTSCFMRSGDDEDEDVYVRATRFDFPRFRAKIEDIKIGHDVIHVVGRKGKGVFGASVYLQQLTVIDPD